MSDREPVVYPGAGTLDEFVYFGADPKLGGYISDFQRQQVEYAQGVLEKNDIRDVEIPLDMEQLEVITNVQIWLNELRKSHGLPEKWVSAAESIHILPVDVYEKKFGKKSSGEFEPRNQQIYVRQSNDHLQLQAILIHELIHRYSYTALELDSEDDGNGGLRNRVVGSRVGIASTNRGTKSGYAVMEGASSELAKRYAREKLYRQPKWAEARQRAEQWHAQSPNGADEMGFDFEEDVDYVSEDGKVYVHPYVDARKGCRMLITDIAWRSSRSRLEVEDVFTKALLNGNRLSLARMISETYGEGMFDELCALPEEDFLAQCENLADSPRLIVPTQNQAPGLPRAPQPPTKKSPLKSLFGKWRKP